MRKGNKLYSILNMKCPKCQEDDLFLHPLFKFKGLLDMKEKCGNCGQKFELEPGFYWGSMYIAYGISSGIILGVFVVLKFLLGFTMTQSYIAVVILILIMIPLVFRLARSLWIHLYVKYDPPK